MSRELERLVPDARIRIAHGRMAERKLEQIMLDFYDQRFNLLIAPRSSKAASTFPAPIPLSSTVPTNWVGATAPIARAGRALDHRAYAYMHRTV